MKTMKLTTVALAMIAAAAFTTSAQAQSASNGDIILGIYDSAASGAAPNSYEVDLGAFSTLTAGETWTLGTSLASTFSSDATPSLVFDIAGSGSTGAGGLASKEIAVTAPGAYSTANGSTTTTPNNNIVLEYGGFSSGTSLLTGTSSTSTSFTAISLADTNGGSFDTAVNNNNGSYGISGSPTILTAYTEGSTVITDFFTTLKATSAQPVADGFFELTGSGAGTKLIFDPVAAPEPSTYALMVGGLLALWMIKRRRSNA